MRRRARRWGLLPLLGLAGALACQIDALAQGPAPTAPPAPAAAPTVTAITPNNGRAVGGASVTVTGTGFATGSTVKFGEASATRVAVPSATSIRAAVPAGEGIVDVRVSNAGGTSAAVPQDRFAYDAPASGPWLGLNGNSMTYLGPVRAFVEHDVVYDRSGPLDVIAGESLKESGRPTRWARTLAADIRRGMIPVITIEYRGYQGEYTSDPRFPTEARGSRTLGEYVKGFLATASAILAAHPGKRILFEPMNEPWGYTTPQFNGAQYADVIAKLLPAARAAGIPLNRIYVAASGKDWIPEMYNARPALESEVQGWYFHPYGPASGSFDHDSRGIQSIARVQAEMTSGQNNIIVSEIGFCAQDVNRGKACGSGQLAHGSEAAQQLTETLDNARPYREAGWLKALLVFSRNDGGWAMQLRHGQLTPPGEALEAFADTQQRPLHLLPFGSQAGGTGSCERLAGFAWLVRLAV